MGLLDGLLGGGSRQQGGGSPLTLALLAFLAYRTYQGKGRLADMLGGGNQSGSDAANQGGRVSGPGHLPDGNPSGPLGQGGGGGFGQGGGGGLGSILGDLFRGGPGARPMGGGGNFSSSGGGLGDILRGGLGGLLGGAAAGTVLNGGLGDLLGRFRQNGFGEHADSWVGTGQNRAISPGDLERALGADTLQSLAQETGRPYNDVLSELSQSLPDAVNHLTPHGREPTDEEASKWV